MSSEKPAEELMGHINTIMRTLLVAAKKGAPAEGKIPFNPLYFNMLRIIGARERLRPSEIAAVFDVSRTTISTAARSLQKRGLIAASADAADGRAMQLSLTAEGQETLSAILRQDLRNSEAMLNALAPSERMTFIAMMDKIAETLSNAPPTD